MRQVSSSSGLPSMRERSSGLSSESAGLVADVEDWPWSGARAQLGLGADGLIEPRGLDH
jgi:hypothetical protein